MNGLSQLLYSFIREISENLRIKCKKYANEVFQFCTIFLITFNKFSLFFREEILKKHFTQSIVYRQLLVMKRFLMLSKNRAILASKQVIIGMGNIQSKQLIGQNIPLKCFQISMCNMCTSVVMLRHDKFTFLYSGHDSLLFRTMSIMTSGHAF